MDKLADGLLGGVRRATHPISAQEYVAFSLPTVG